MHPLEMKPPIVQVAIDVLNIPDALRIAEAAVKAGVDWLECGTPLVTFTGTTCICALAREFPGVPILADYKCMDGARKYALETRAQGGHLCTVCAQAADATVRTMVAAGKEAGVSIVCDLINAPDVAARAAEVEAMGVESVYVHWGSDQKAEDSSRDPQLDLRAVVERVSIPVGIATFSAEDGVRAIKQGAKIVVIGFPVIGHADVEGALREYVGALRSV
jgi:3-hexulose-6-phosphate synthase/6-phospho-3-hexuloisomerase